jgi:hypothetical protein
MDTTTVLEIIKMIDNQIDNYKEKMELKGIDLVMPVEKELTSLRDHLQGFIEAQVSAIENQGSE